MRLAFAFFALLLISESPYARQKYSLENWFTGWELADGHPCRDTREKLLVRYNVYKNPEWLYREVGGEHNGALVDLARRLIESLSEYVRLAERTAGEG